MDSKDEKGKGKKGKEKMTTDVAKDLASLNVGSGDDLIEADGGSSASSMNLMVPDTDDDGATEKGGHSDDELLS